MRVFVRVLLILSLAVALVAARGSIELADPGDGDVAAAVLELDLDRAPVITELAGAPVVARDVMQAHRATELAPSVPERGRVFRPPECA